MATLSPAEIVSVPNGNAAYFCTPSAAFSNGEISNFQWLLNDTLMTSGSVMLSLSVSSNLNTTRVRCWAQLSSGVNSISSETLLLVQG